MNHPLRFEASAVTKEAEVRRTGIWVVGDVPWGTHFFLFYETKEDLLDALVPYFKAGLQAGEFCVWVVHNPLIAQEVKRAMRRAVPGFDRYLKSHSIEIPRASEFYHRDKEFDQRTVIERWNEKLEYAMANRYAGLRLSSNTAWLKKKDWSAFANYEEAVNKFFTGKRVLALCTYVARTHQFAVARRNKDWEMVETAQLKQAKAEIKKLNDELEQRVDKRTGQLMIAVEELQKEIEKRQRVQAALQQSQEELAHIGRLTALGELAASIAHEVGQPLTAIVTNGSFVLRKLGGTSTDQEDLREAAEAIVADGKRASSVIARIRALLKKQDTVMVEVDINDAILEVV
jgi:C4-dicarboxylate-specific signal transduction histidine kinase